jgi:hypothetical protein
MTITATIDGTPITATFDKLDENGDPTDPGSPVIGSWNATTFVANGVDGIAAGMGLLFTFDNVGTYTFNVTNDQLGFCDGNVGDDCADTGGYDATGTQITLDPGTVDAAVLNYTISGNTMSVGALIDGAPITATFDKQ